MRSSFLLPFWAGFSFFFFICSASRSMPLNPPNNVTLLGDAHFRNKTTISLTQELGCAVPSSCGVGRALYAYPIRFLDPRTNTTSSFLSRFSFSIVPVSSSYSSSFGDGLTFLITSNANAVGSSAGYIGLSDHTSAQESFVAVEFDTSFNPSLDDINDNHIGLDINSVVSFASVDAFSMGIDLKNGRRLTAWIEYSDAMKMIRVWVGYSQFRPPRPVLAVHVDLCKQFREFMHVGFSASNGRGAALHLVESWHFRTYGFLHPMDTIQEEGCFMCSIDDFSIIENEPSSKKARKIGELGLVLGGAAAFVFSALVIIAGTSWYLIKRRRTSCRRDESQKICGNQMMKVPTRLSLAEIKSATRGFNRSRIIGEGASGTVYEGCLSSGTAVAVKRFSRISQIDQFRNPFTTEFATMVDCLRHRNLLQLQGWCCEGDELVLVYEYMSNGSLDRVLHKNTLTLLTWEHRLNIILGVASALTYLHEECERQIIHRDIKACNVMLDSNFNAKLGDFGLAEVYDHSTMTREATIPAGTMGYLAPEYVHSGIPTEKTDVYSFGVLVLEVATGRRPIDNDGTVLVDWVWSMWAKGIVMDAVDHKLMGKFDKGGMERMFMVGLSCVHPNCKERPTVKESARMLRGEAPLPVLPTRKPRVRLQSPLPEAPQVILQENNGDREDDGFEETPWSTPRSRFGS